MNLSDFYLSRTDDVDEMLQIALGRGCHVLVPVSQPFDWPSEVTQWRCTGCGEVWDGLPERFVGCREETT